MLGAAPALIVPFVRFDGAHPYRDVERAEAEREMFLLSGGAAIQNLLLALHAQLVASCWISSTLFCQDETRSLLGLDDGLVRARHGRVRADAGGRGRAAPPSGGSSARSRGSSSRATPWTKYHAKIAATTYISGCTSRAFPRSTAMTV